MALCMSLSVSCGNPRASLSFTAPSMVAAGSPFTVTVTAMVGGSRDTMINSYIIFSTSDSSGILPANYQFTATDAGSHTWLNGFVLKSPGNQTISATIYDAAGIHGTANVTVSP